MERRKLQRADSAVSVANIGFILSVSLDVFFADWCENSMEQKFVKPTHVRGLYGIIIPRRAFEGGMHARTRARGLD